jgi:hypothetical protein
MIYLIVDQTFANTKNLNEAIHIIKANVDNYKNATWDQLIKANRTVRYFCFHKQDAEESFKNFWTTQGDKFKLIEVSSNDSFDYIP